MTSQDDDQGPGVPPLAASGHTFVSRSGCAITLAEREYISFAGCDYLGLATDARVVDALQEGVREAGIGASASRVTSGESLEHTRLERDLAQHVGQEAAALLPDGYLANLAAVEATEEAEVVLIDSAAHPSLLTAARAADLPVHEYARRAPEGPFAACSGRRRLVLTDSILEGGRCLAPVGRLVELLEEGDTLILDDCHGLGVLGEHGRGLLESAAVTDSRLRVTGTLAKSLGCQGGVAAGPQSWISRLRSRASAYTTTTPIPPALARAARRALSILREDHGLRGRLISNIRALRKGLESLGLDSGCPGPAALSIAHIEASHLDLIELRLRDAGFFAPILSYPGGPAPRYLRLAVSAAHSPDDIRRLLSVLRAALAERTGHGRCPSQEGASPA